MSLKSWYFDGTSKGAPGSKCQTGGWSVGSSSAVVKKFLEVCITDWLNAFLRVFILIEHVTSAFLHYKISSTAKEYWYLHFWTPSYSDWLPLFTILLFTILQIQKKKKLCFKKCHLVAIDIAMVVGLKSNWLKWSFIFHLNYNEIINSNYDLHG